MTVRVGVVGVGSIGTAHVRLLARSISGSSVVAVHDVNQRRAVAIGDEVGARAFASAEALIADDGVDAVVIASPDAEHVPQVRACIDVGKPALCEKPLAPVPADALDVMAAEVSLGRRLVTLGFMRRFDPAYAQLKQRLESGEVGVPLLVHCVHRNQQVARDHTSAMSLTNSVPHEIDVNRWLLGEEYASVQVIAGRSTPHAAGGLQDPLLVILRSTSGIIVEIEWFGNAPCGYEVRCEVVASEGTLELGGGPVIAPVRAGAHGRTVPEQWLGRFEEAYRIELQAWVDSIRSGTAAGPSIWDGYVATAVAGACVASLEADQRMAISLVPRPNLYLEGPRVTAGSAGTHPA